MAQSKFLAETTFRNQLVFKIELTKCDAEN